jgi:polysaccharide biosynthesis/export protein
MEPKGRSYLLGEKMMRSLLRWITVIAILSYSCAPKPYDSMLLEGEADPFEAPDKAVYKIGSGDVLDISTWKEPDFTKEVHVRTDGHFTFPLLDEIDAADRTPLDVKAEINEKLKAYVKAPVVTVSVKQPESKKYYILGEIQKTGEYPLFKELTLLQAFAIAGGFTEWASKKEIMLIRREGGKNHQMRLNYKDIVRGKNLKQNILIQPNDTIIVP